MAIHRPTTQPVRTAASPGRASSALRRLAQLGPLVVALLVAKGVLDYLPDSLSSDAARYLLAACGAVASGVSVALVAVLVQRRVEEVQEGSRQRTGDVLSKCHQALLDCRVTVEDGRLVGWPHFIEEARAGVRPTAIGTAYGLKSCTFEHACLEQDKLIETLWRLQLPDLGWAARTQSGVGRPEVTALILGALSRTPGDPARLAETVAAFEQCIADDTGGRSRTYVVSATMGGLLRAAPGSSSLPELRQLLLVGRIRDPRNENLLCWADELENGQEYPLVPSVPHTARAIVALSGTIRVLGANGQTMSALQDGIRWLISHSGVDRQTEQIRRSLAEHRSESLTVRHFTPALVARALLCPEAAAVEGRDELLTKAIRQVWASQHNGTWEWDNGQHPLWMTYQGISALRAHALHTGVQPP